MKKMPIERFLSWAFNEELPKGGSEDGLNSAGSAWSALTGFAELGTIIDTGYRDAAGSSMFFEQGDPHPDALVAGEAVAALVDRYVEIPDGWNPFPDWPDPHGLIAADINQAIERYQLRPAHSRRTHIVQLVVSAAVLGRGPDWQSDLPKTRMVYRAGKAAWFVKRKVRDRLGRTYITEVDGQNPTSRRPYRNAYRRYEMAESLVADAMGRMDWEIWVDALTDLNTSLRGKLANHQTTTTQMHRNPWRLVKSAPPQPVANGGVAGTHTLNTT